MELKPGQMLGNLRLEQRIGAGGMGEVWKAKDAGLDLFRAVKILLPEVSVEQLRREAKNHALVRSPNVVNIIAFLDDPLPAIVLEFVDGETLARRIRGRKASHHHFPLTEVRTTMGDIVNGVIAIHNAGEFSRHRDLKPENIMIDAATGLAKILDFGIAKSDACRTGVIGTPHYMSLEQYRNAEDQRCDIWAISAIAYELLTLEKAYAGDYEGIVRSLLSGRRPPAPSSLRADLPRPVDEFFHAAFAPNIDERPQTAMIFWKALRRVLDGEQLFLPNRAGTIMSAASHAPSGRPSHPPVSVDSFSPTVSVAQIDPQEAVTVKRPPVTPVVPVVRPSPPVVEALRPPVVPVVRPSPPVVEALRPTLPLEAKDVSRSPRRPPPDTFAQTEQRRLPYVIPESSKYGGYRHRPPDSSGGAEWLRRLMRPLMLVLLGIVLAEFDRDSALVSMLNLALRYIDAVLPLQPNWPARLLVLAGVVWAVVAIVRPREE